MPIPGVLLLAAAAGGLFLLSQASKTKATAKTTTDTGGSGTGVGTPTGAGVVLGSDTGQQWEPISPFAPPGSDMALASATLLSLKLIDPSAPLKGSMDLLGSEVMLILQGSEKRSDQVAKPLVAVTGKVTKVYSMSGTSVDTVDVLVDAVVNQNSDASKLPPTALPNLGVLRVSALQVAAKTG